jgi:coenzyme F420-reducing hydrogenase delta subunit
MKNRKQRKREKKEESVGTAQPSRIIIYCCERSAFRAVESLLTDVKYNGVEFVKVECTGRIGVHDILKRLEDGAYSVVVAGCPPGSCQHSDGSSRAERNVAIAVKELSDAMLDGYRVRMCFVSSVDTKKMVDIIEEEMKHDSGRA